MGLPSVRSNQQDSSQRSGIAQQSRSLRLWLPLSLSVPSRTDPFPGRYLGLDSGGMGMGRNRHTADQTVGKPCGAEVHLSKKMSVARVCKQIGITDPACCRGPKESGGLKADQAKRVIEIAVCTGGMGVRGLTFPRFCTTASLGPDPRRLVLEPGWEDQAVAPGSREDRVFASVARGGIWRGEKGGWRDSNP